MAFKDIAILLFFSTILQYQLHKSIALDNQTWIKAGYWQYGETSNIESINSTLYTHLIYGYADMYYNSSTEQVNVTISSDDEPVKNFNSIVKKKNPSIKTLVSIEMNRTMSNANLITGRKFFIESSIEIARSYGFDGLDFTWSWPSSSQEMSNLATLLDDWRVAIDLESKQTKNPRLLLTMISKNTPWIEDWTYPIESMKENLDWLHVFAFDYYEPWSTNNTSPFAALYDPNSDLNTDYGINAWIKYGFPSQKIVLGLPFYGCVWTLVSPENNQIGAAATGAGPAIMCLKMSRSRVILHCWDNNIKTYMIKYHANNSSHNSTYVMNYVSVGTSWVGFDDVEAVKTKVSYAKEGI
ncbi:putative G-type lectin S-receptor-like serine/threonine-protein kinase-like [Capsicum annuum]|nr:putative G-type lectin S-receptor-like serine/threonine-protein kinase-like [Capsicum annuum]